MRWFRRKKEKPTEETSQRAQDDSLTISTAPENVVVEKSPRSKNPVEAFIQRVEEIISESSFVEKSKALKPTRIQLIVGGQPLLLSKEGLQALSLKRERSIHTDVFIRMDEAAARQLADTNTLEQFKKVYRGMLLVKGTSSFVSLKLHTPLAELRSLGYFSLEFLRILIDA